ncbi:MAG TPA: hypothetical protein VGW74_11815 [Propionibacteriaceae bacterium]|nr:hypothetical protein [Propionibacteriaceae bacterium]
MSAGLRIEPVTADMLAEEEKRRTVEATCPKCGAVSQVVELDANYDVDGLFGPPGRRWRPALRGFEMGCGCYVPANGWTLQVQLDPFRAWFEANR